MGGATVRNILCATAACSTVRTNNTAVPQPVSASWARKELHRSPPYSINQANIEEAEESVLRRGATETGERGDLEVLKGFRKEWW